MRGVYTAEVKMTAIGVAGTLLYIEVPSTKCVEIISATLTNKSNNAAEQLEAAIGVYASGTATGFNFDETTVRKHEAGDANTTVTIKTANASTPPSAFAVFSSEPTYGAVQFGHEAFSNLGSGWQFRPVAEERPTLAPSSAFGLRLLAAPSAAFDGIASITYREIG